MWWTRSGLKSREIPVYVKVPKATEGAPATAGYPSEDVTAALRIVRSHQAGIMDLISSLNTRLTLMNNDLQAIREAVVEREVPECVNGSSI